MKKFRVLVFGSTGTGKTSLCNTLSGHKMPASDSPVGVTFYNYNYPEFTIQNNSMIITDTVGLNESDKGKVNAADSVQSLISLFQKSQEGYNLLIHVMRSPRITKSHADNYHFFVEVFTANKIPCILVVTGCENSDPLSQWADQNAAVFSEQSLKYKKIISTCFAEGGRLESVYAPLREESKQALIEAITYNASSSPIKLYESDVGFYDLIKNAWNEFCGYVGKIDWMIVVNETLYAALMRMGVPERIAKILATGTRTTDRSA